MKSDPKIRPTKEQYIGCLLGLAMGDALGAPYEGGLLERILWYFIGNTQDGSPRWTDDTQMSINIAESILKEGHLNQKDIAERFTNSYRWRRGYGPSTAKLLKRIRRGQTWEEASKSVYPSGSYGNGAAMRAPVLALFFPNDVKALIHWALKAPY